jgi:glucose-6-phosphate isomerase
MSHATIAPLRYDYSGTLLDKHGISASDLHKLVPDLEKARQEVEVDLQQYKSQKIPADKQPLDAAFYDLPERLLSEYRSQGDASELGRILAAAQRIQELVDSVVVLGIGGSYMGARALMEACCHPYHNELPREERNNIPRMYFEGNNIDNDSSQALLHMLRLPGKSSTVNQSWAIVVISKSGGTLETAVAFRQYLRELVADCGGDRRRVAELVVPVTGASGRLHDLAQALGCPEEFRVPDGVGGRFSILSPVGLLPAAVLGIDVVRLLEGAATMNEQFRTAPPGKNPVLDYVGVCHLMEKQRGANIRILSVWAKSLESSGLWYDQLLAESLGKQEQGAMPLTVVNTRDLHSRAQQHQEGRRDKLVTNVIVENWKREPLPVGHSDLDQDKLNELADKTLPDLMTAAIQGTNQAYRGDNRPTADLYLPHVDEASLGQFFQMMMLATVVEGRLMGINPYGQPGVEMYKQHMNANLRK